jgi:hypothetical protein
MIIFNPNRRPESWGKFPTVRRKPGGVMGKYKSGIQNAPVRRHGTKSRVKLRASAYRAGTRGTCWSMFEITSNQPLSPALDQSNGEIIL